MKNYIIGIALALALVMGVVAFAETAEPATDPVPAVTEETTAEDTTAEPPAAEAEEADDGTALREAMEAYRAARETKRIDELTEELNGYVEAGAMTQEQADLILNSVKERTAAQNDADPNCGYEFRSKGHRMGGQRGQFGGDNQRGGRMSGQLPGDQQQPDAQSGATSRQPNRQQPYGRLPGDQQASQR